MLINLESTGATMNPNHPYCRLIHFIEDEETGAAELVEELWNSFGEVSHRISELHAQREPREVGISVILINQWGGKLQMGLLEDRGVLHWLRDQGRSTQVSRGTEFTEDTPFYLPEWTEVLAGFLIHRSLALRCCESWLEYNKLLPEAGFDMD